MEIKFDINKNLNIISSNIISFSIHIKDGKRRYGCRGTGFIYKNFYKWLNTKKIIDSTDDFPWDYFSLNKEDEQEFLNSWIKYQGINDPHNILSISIPRTGMETT